MAERKKPDSKNPVNPEDYNPTHDGEYPHDEHDITGEKEVHLADTSNAYEVDMTDEEGRQPGMRRTGQFIVPNDEDMAGEGWTLPTRAGGGWDHPVEPSLEEQIDEPDQSDKEKKRERLKKK